jgi:hypothetical protein
MEQFAHIYIIHSNGTNVKNKTSSAISSIKSEIRTWSAFEGPLGDVIHDKRFLFAWKEGCLMGICNTLEEATPS